MYRGLNIVLILRFFVVAEVKVEYLLVALGAIEKISVSFKRVY